MKRTIKGFLALALAALLAAAPALAMGEQGAEALVKAADPRAAKAKQFWVYPEGDGAWVFYGTGYNSKEALFKGGFWYVTEDKQTQLGEYTENVMDWELLDSVPRVFTSTTRYGGARHVHAALLKDGAPVEIAVPENLISLDGYEGSIVGLMESDIPRELEKVFLGVRENHLVEIAARSITEAQARAIDGMDALLEELSKDTFFGPAGTVATGFLFRNAVPGEYRGGWGSVTINVNNNGKAGRLYAYIDREGKLYPERGWENELAISEGAAKERYDVGLEIVETVAE